MAYNSVPSYLSPWASPMMMDQNNMGLMIASLGSQPQVQPKPVPPPVDQEQSQYIPSVQPQQSNPFNFAAFGNSPADKEYVQAFKDMMTKRDKDVQGLEGQLDEAKGKSFGGLENTDLTPLASLVDNWTGSNFTQSYKAPTAKAKNEAEIQRLQDAIRKERGALSDDQLQYLKDRAANSNTRSLLESAKQQRFNDSQNLKMENTMRTDLEKVAKEHQDTQGFLNMAEDALKRGNYKDVGMYIAAIARNVGDQKGALSDTDIAMTFPKDLATSVAGLESYLGGQGQLSPEVQKAMLGLISAARNKSSAIHQNAIARRKAAYSAGAYAPLMQPGQVGDVIFQNYGGSVQPQVPKQPSSAPKKILSPAEFFSQGPKS